MGEEDSLSADGDRERAGREIVVFERQLDRLGPPQVWPRDWGLHVNTSFLQELLGSIAEQGRQLLPRSLGGAEPQEEIRELAAALLSGRGEASGVAIARAILEDYRRLAPDERRAFLAYIAETMQPDTDRVAHAAKAYLAHPEPSAVAALQRAVESPRQEFFRRLNLAPGATAQIVAMRRDMLSDADDPQLAHVERDLMHLLASWFNRGFLVLRRIDWQTPAAILEKIIEYEAVHEIKGWDDLRRRLDPADRRCFAFFHPSLIDEPLIFVEVALTTDIPDSIQSLLAEEPKNGDAEEKPTTAVFYSISNCQEGLRGISFGNFLIKQVVEDLAEGAREPQDLRDALADPGLCRLARAPAHGRQLRAAVACRARPACRAGGPGLGATPPRPSPCAPCCSGSRRTISSTPRRADGQPVDPVARFHLGNGARLERINWQGDISAKGLREAHGLMCNYRYELKDIEKNHEAYVNEGVVAASRQVHAL